MNLVDICIIIFLLFGFLIGWKSGFTKKLVSTVGFIVVIILSFLFKNLLSGLFYNYLPFIEFKGSFEGVSVINILFYEVLAFIIIFSLLMVIFRIILKTSSGFEKVLNATIILGIPSKILGGIVGIIENYIITFFVIYFLSIPLLDMKLITNSFYATKLMNKTPILSTVCQDTLKVYDEIKELKDNYKDDKDKKELNEKIIELLLEHDIVSEENIDNLIKKGKIEKINR